MDIHSNEHQNLQQFQQIVKQTLHTKWADQAPPKEQELKRERKNSRQGGQGKNNQNNFKSAAFKIKNLLDVYSPEVLIKTMKSE